LNLQVGAIRVRGAETDLYLLDVEPRGLCARDASGVVAEAANTEVTDDILYGKTPGIAATTSILGQMN
jgi:hypothetical protein